MSKHGSVQEGEIEKFFNDNALNGLLYYRETLLSKYGQAKKIPESASRRSPQQI